MWTSAGFNRGDSRRIYQAGPAQTFGILLRYKIVRYYSQIHAASLEGRDKLLQERGLAGANRATDADTRCSQAS
jgi:hypothetical protein